MPKTTKSPIAKIVRMARGTRTQEQFAAIVKKTRDDIAKYENGFAIPTGITIMRVLKQIAVFRNGKASLPADIFDPF